MNRLQMAQKRLPLPLPSSTSRKLGPEWGYYGTAQETLRLKSDYSAISNLLFNDAEE